MPTSAQTSKSNYEESVEVVKVSLYPSLGIPSHNLVEMQMIYLQAQQVFETGCILRLVHVSCDFSADISTSYAVVLPVCFFSWEAASFRREASVLPRVVMRYYMI